MGALKSRPDERPKPQSLREREDAYLQLFIEEHLRLREWATENDGNLKTILQPGDNSMHANDSFVPTPLPRDADGFVLSFPPDDARGIHTFFDAHGVVVVRGVIDLAACASSRTEVWDLLEREVSTVSRNDARTWDRWTSLAWGGFVGNTFNLSPQLCQNRQEPKVHAAFAAVLGRQDLHVNVGRVGAMRPTRRVAAGPLDPSGQPSIVDKPEWKTLASNDWLHWDCNPFTGAVSTFSWALHDPVANRDYLNNTTAVQAILALGDCGEHDGGFYCVPGSHKALRSWAHAHQHLSSSMQSPEGPMQIKLPKGDDEFKRVAEKVPIRAGDLVIWNAATLHCNYPNDSQNLRLVQFIQMKPADDHVMGTLLKDISLLPPAAEFSLTPLGRKLYGFEPWEERKRLA